MKENKLTGDRLEKLAQLYKMDVVDLISLNDQTFINTISHSQGVCSHQITINSPIGDEERRMYQSTIDRLDRENETTFTTYQTVRENN